jgi:uncharacterized protein YjbI with pentapeptide repeats
MRKISEITINGRALQEILDAHKHWLEPGVYEGRADLSGADLSGAVLSGAVLSRADLSGAVLSGADLSRAVLSRADLSRADLSRADLSGAVLSGAVLSRADLSRADLSGADLSGADLSGAVLSGAVLSGAVLSRADLSGADLSGADLSGAVLSGAVLSGAVLSGAVLSGAVLSRADLSGAVLSGAKNIPDYVRAVTCILPDGKIIGWKKCNNSVIVKMEIPAKAKRSNATGRKCRAEFAKVLALYDVSTMKELAEDCIAITNIHGPRTEYQAGKTTKCDKWNEDNWVECGGGIHFFITELEARGMAVAMPTTPVYDKLLSEVTDKLADEAGLSNIEKAQLVSEAGGDYKKAIEALGYGGEPSTDDINATLSENEDFG